MDCVFNLLSKAVLEQEVSMELLNNAKIGKKMYEEFVDQRIKGSTSVWAKMKKRNLKTFKSQSKVAMSMSYATRFKIKDKIVKLKEERNLVT